MDNEFTEQQLADWKKYERVRKGGNFNMYDPRARRATGLDSDRYVFVMRNFAALKKAVEDAAIAATGSAHG